MVWSGVCPTCGYCRLVVSDCVQYQCNIYPCRKLNNSVQYIYRLNVSVEFHVEVCSGISSVTARCIWKVLCDVICKYSSASCVVLPAFISCVLWTLALVKVKIFDLGGDWNGCIVER